MLCVTSLRVLIRVVLLVCAFAIFPQLETQARSYRITVSEGGNQVVAVQELWAHAIPAEISQECALEAARNGSAQCHDEFQLTKIRFDWIPMAHYSARTNEVRFSEQSGFTVTEGEAKETMFTFGTLIILVALAALVVILIQRIAEYHSDKSIWYGRVVFEQALIALFVLVGAWFGTTSFFEAGADDKALILALVATGAGVAAYNFNVGMGSFLSGVVPLFLMADTEWSFLLVMPYFAYIIALQFVTAGVVHGWFIVKRRYFNKPSSA